MTLYINVEDLAAYRKRVVDAGGKIHVEEQEVPGMGALSLFTDPEGRMMGCGSKLQRNESSALYARLAQTVALIAVAPTEV
jgi:hypothetical protein